LKSNYYLLAVGLFVAGLILIPVSVGWGWPFDAAPALVWMLALFAGGRGYKMTKERRLQRYAEEIERRMH